MYFDFYENIAYLGGADTAFLAALPNVRQRQDLGISMSDLLPLGTGWTVVGVSAKALNARYQIYQQLRHQYRITSRRYRQNRLVLGVVNEITVDVLLECR